MPPSSPASPSDTASGILHHIHLSILKSLSVRSIYNHLLFTLNLSTPEYILVRVLSLLHTLAQISPDTNFSSRTSARSRNTRRERVSHAGAGAWVGGVFNVVHISKLVLYLLRDT